MDMNGHEKDDSTGTSNNNNNEETPLLNSTQQFYQRGNDNAVSLDTLADTIGFIIKRDSEIALYKEKKTSSPWKLDSIVRSPMLSSPRGTVMIPDLQKRRQDQIKRHDLQQKQRARDKKNAKRAAAATTANQNEMYHIEIENEDEQWERKRLAKLQKVMMTSAASNNSFNSITEFSPNGKASKQYSPTADILKELKIEFSKTETPHSASILYGIINTVIVLPVLMSFGSIIYHDDFFKPYMPVLVRITVISGIVHQLSFSTFSTLPFSVGQVQDAGLLFLSTMASNIVKYCKNDGRNDEEILATTLIGLSLFTAILGLSLVLIGRLRLASYVEYLPTPVVGGYLAFIGFFCGQGGMALMSNVEVEGIMDWYKFGHMRQILLSLPGLIGGIGIYVSMRTIKHMAVLPCAVTLIIVTFYITLEVGGLSLEDAKEMGWVNHADAPPVWYHTWDYFKFDKVVWSALPGQSLTAISMIIVVALSSSLDIAAIDLEIPKPLEYNYELRMIGLSNILSGLSGGYTGSYIFSQTIFSLRAGIRSPLMGYVIAICEAITVIIPISLLSYVPNFVFGSLLIMICVDLMVEWLWDVRSKLSKAEYCVALSTFVFIQISSVEYGIIGGSVLHYILVKLGFDLGNSRDDEEAREDESSGYEFGDDSRGKMVTETDGYQKVADTFLENENLGSSHSSPIMV